MRALGAIGNGMPSLPGGKHGMLTDSAYEHIVLVTSEGGLAVVTPLVQVSAWNAQYFWEALASVTWNHAIIVADLTAQEDCDWHAMGALIMALRYTDVGGGELRVAAGSPSVRGTLATAGLDRLLAVFDGLEDALPNGDPPPEAGCPGLAPA